MRPPPAMMSSDELLAEIAGILDDIVDDAELAEAVAGFDGLDNVERARELVQEAKSRAR